MSIPSSGKERLFTFALDNNIQIWGSKTRGEIFSFFVYQKDADKIRNAFSELIISERMLGVSRLILQLRSRIGILLGAIAFFAILTYTSTHLWDVRVSGNRAVGDDEIISVLEECGLSIGKRISGLEMDQICVDFLNKDEKISYITVNMRGNVAYVDVIEASRAENDTDNGDRAVNIVAKDNAVIESINVYSGRGVVKKGDVVLAGDLLISGIGDGLNKTEIVNANGEVLGRVSHDFYIEIPKIIATKSYTNRKNIGFSINFFGKTLNILKYSGNLPYVYDTIESKEQLSVFGKINLPIYITKTVALQYQSVDCPLSENEMVKLAYNRLNSEISSTLSGAMLVEKRTYGEFIDGKFILTSRVISIEDISKKSEIIVE